MNVPVPPPVELTSLGALASIRRPPARRARPAAALLLGAGAGVVLAWRLASRPRRRHVGAWIAGGGLGALAAAAVTFWQLPRLFTAQPPYTVEVKRGRFEVRYYGPLRLAATTVDATWGEALEEGFRRLARFVFGDPRSAHPPASMPAPVLGTGDGEGFHIAFVLPPEADVPALGGGVDVGSLPARRVAVLRFHGPGDAASIEAHKHELAHALARYGLSPRGRATFAGYDPPSTWPFLRRNELWVELV